MVTFYNFSYLVKEKHI